MDAHPEWPPLASVVKMCKQHVPKAMRLHGLFVKRSGLYDPPLPYPVHYLEFRSSVLNFREQPPNELELWKFTGVAASGDFRQVELLLNSRADIDTPTVLGFTMMHEAAAFARLGRDDALLGRS